MQLHSLSKGDFEYWKIFLPRIKTEKLPKNMDGILSLKYLQNALFYGESIKKIASRSYHMN